MCQKNLINLSKQQLTLVLMKLRLQLAVVLIMIYIHPPLVLMTHIAVHIHPLVTQALVHLAQIKEN